MIAVPAADGREKRPRVRDLHAELPGGRGLRAELRPQSAVCTRGPAPPHPSQRCPVRPPPRREGGTSAERSEARAARLGPGPFLPPQVSAADGLPGPGFSFPRGARLREGSLGGLGR